MKTMHWAVVMALLVAAPVLAQRPGGPGARGAGRQGPTGRAGTLDRMVEIALERRDSLALSADQVQRLEALRGDLAATATQLREEREEARADAGRTRGQMQGLQERVRVAREDQRERFQQLLSEEQRERLNGLARRERGGVARPGRGSDGPAGPGPGARGAVGNPRPGRGGPVGPRGAEFGAGGGGSVELKAYRQGWLDAQRAVQPRGLRRGPGPGFRGR